MEVGDFEGDVVGEGYFVGVLMWDGWECVFGFGDFGGEEVSFDEVDGVVVEDEGVVGV